MSLAKQNKQLGPALRRAIGAVLDSGVYILGPQGKAFEDEFSKTLGLGRVLGVDSGTSALELALRAVGVGPGDEVIVPTFTFIATATAVSAVGGVPVMADVDEQTLTLTADGVKEKISGRTRAVVPVHIFGQPADMDPLVALCSEKGLSIVEDCAQAHLTRYKGRPAGTIGDIAAFSFYPSKNLGAAGDAGALACGRRELDTLCEELRNCGRQPGVAYKHVRVGHNCRLDEIQAAVLRVKLKKLAAWTRRRREIAALYDKGLARLPLKRPSLGESGTKPSFHLYVVRTPRRDELSAHLKAAGIGSGVYYPIPVHRQPAYAELGLRPEDFPVAERACREVLALPMFPELGNAEVARVCREIKAFFDSK